MEDSKKAAEDLRGFRPPLQQTSALEKAGTSGVRPSGGRTKSSFVPGLSGAAYKWYARFVEEGMDPKEAKKRALNRPKSEPNPPPKEKKKARTLAEGKREISRESPTEAEKKKVKTSHGEDTEASGTKKPRADHVPPEENAKHYAKIRVIPVGIIPQGFPEVALSKDESKDIRKHIFKQIQKGWTTLIRLVDIHHKAGYIIVDCWDEETTEWLAKTVQESQETLNIELRTVKGDDIPQETVITAFLPNAAELEEQEALKTLQASNPVNTATWHLIGCHVAGTGRLLRAAITPAEQLRIAELDSKLFFGFGQVEVSGLSKTKGSTQSREAIAGKTDRVMSSAVDRMEGGAAVNPPVKEGTEDPNSAVGESEEEELLRETGSSTEAMDSEDRPDGQVQ